MEQDYKKLYEETKKELEEIKLNSMSSKEKILGGLANFFGDKLKEKRSYGTGENLKEYDCIVDFYQGLYNIRKDILIELLKKLQNKK